MNRVYLKAITVSFVMVALFAVVERALVHLPG
jgi:hypothetical protein